MSFPVVMLVHQLFCLLFKPNRLFNDQVKQVRHLNNDFVCCIFVVVNKSFVNSVVTKMSASMSGFKRLNHLL